MIFTETALKGAFVIEPEPVNDDRGFFARTWCQQEFSAQGLNATWVVQQYRFQSSQRDAAGHALSSGPA